MIGLGQHYIQEFTNFMDQPGRITTISNVLSQVVSTIINKKLTPGNTVLFETLQIFPVQYVFIPCKQIDIEKAIK